MKTLKIIITDGVVSASLICFNRTFLQHSLPAGSIIAVTGTFTEKYGQIQSTDFDVTKLADSGELGDFKGMPLPDSGILPVYHLTEGLTQKTVRKAVKAAIQQYLRGIDDEVPAEYISSRNLLPKQKAVELIHAAQTPQEIQEARRTLIYEELFLFQKIIATRALKHKGFLPDAAVPYETAESGKAETPLSPEFIDSFIKNLSPMQMQLYLRLLLQGDGGSGKTLVAFFACLRAINLKGQCALMAPTEILARQHAEKAAELLEPLGLKVAFLTGNVKSAGRARLLKELKAGNIDLIIGTHALFSKNVQYNDLHLVVIDEQHRFGVVQRQAIVDKGRHSESNPGTSLEPHLLMMSATPIPQTLALTVFGDLDVSTIKSMPKGRKPVTTYLVKEGNEHNAYEAVRKQLEQGHQAYFVYPAIDAEHSSQDIKSAEENFKNLSQNVFPQYKCALLHSRIDEDEQISILKDFRENRIQILAATTVIEVGVDVPNATSIVIEHADRFGMAQLHQLRGRVGRGSDQSFCFLIYSSKITQTGIERMKVLRQNTDGFLIAESDLKLRGPGEITGTVQAGNLTLGIADLARDHEILMQARYDAFTSVKNEKN